MIPATMDAWFLDRGRLASPVPPRMSVINESGGRGGPEAEVSEI